MDHKHTEILPDIIDSCRLCLKSDSNIRNIFCNNHLKWAETDISEQILQATTIKVTTNDGAIGICRSCLKNVVSINNFQRKCIKTNEYLKSKYKGIYFSNEFVSKTIVPNNFGQFVDIGEEIEHTKTTFLLDDIDGLSNNIPSPIFDNFFQSDEDEEKIDFKCDTSDLTKENPLFCDKKSEKKPLMKCKYTLKNDRKIKPFEPLPKLKKRDLNQSKAYVGLCHICGKNFNHLWVHLQSHSDIPTDTCDICGKGFRSKTSLSLHILMHKDADLPCEICGKRYRTKMRLKRHLRVHTGDRPFSCHICQKKFYTKYNVDVHLRIHTGEKPFNCDYCAERFTHSYALKHHLKKFHAFVKSE